MIFNKRSILALFTSGPGEAESMARRWTAAAQTDPDLMSDVIKISGLLAQRSRRFENGNPVPEPVDPTLLAIEQGRRELAIELLALMSLNPYEFQTLMEQNDDYQ